MRINAGNAALDPLLDLLEPVRGDVDVLRGFCEDVAPGKRVKGGELEVLTWKLLLLLLLTKSE